MRISTRRSTVGTANAATTTAMVRAVVVVVLLLVVVVGLASGFTAILPIGTTTRLRVSAVERRADAFLATTTTALRPAALSRGEPEDDDAPSSSSSNAGTAERLKAEAAALKAEAEKLRSEIDERTAETRSETGDDDDETAVVATSGAASASAVKAPPPSSPWAIVSSSDAETEDDDDEDVAVGYRLYVDIGREDGTWMDPRWGASGDRIEFTLDVAFRTDRAADPDVAAKMVKDNSMGRSSAVCAVDNARFARLRDGLDRMECTGAAYRIDEGGAGGRGGARTTATNTIRIVVDAEGTVRADQSYVYGDVSIPPGCLYFSLPAFGNGVRNLSTKEGIVSVRQVGWHTGWRREESRTLGVFTARSLEEAKARDGY